MIAGSFKYSAEKALKQASEAWDFGDYQTAARLYERYLDRDPTGERSLQARFQLAGVYYFNLRNYEQARAQYREFLNQAAPSNPNAYSARERLAEVLAELGRSYEAIAEYEALNPQEETERRRVRLRIADLYFDQKNYSQALTEYARVTDKRAYDDLSEQAYLREASIYHLSRSQYQQALPIYRRLAFQTADPKVRRRALYNMVDCYTRLYQFDEAIRTLHEIKDASEQTYIVRRVAELEQQSREAGRATLLKKAARQ